MTWLTSLPAAVLVISGLVLASTRRRSSLPSSATCRRRGLRLAGPLRTVLPQDTASASSPTCSRLDEVGTKMSSSQPASANAAA